MDNKNTNNEYRRMIHVIKRQGSWAVKKHGASRASRIYDSKEEAIQGARELRDSDFDLVIHKSDGSIQRWERSAK
jgi:uncharacterized protein YdaT